jgi:Fe-S oxidoreductase
MQILYEYWTGKKHKFKVSSILEVMARYFKEGKIQVDNGKIKETVTYHDPCQFGRNAGFYDLPREIIKEVTTDFRELQPNREKNWCCGGGGGLVAQPDYDKLRLETGMKKVEQIINSGAKTVISPCENCRLQLDNLNEKYELGISISSMMDFVANALVIPDKKPAKKTKKDK